MKKLRVIYGEEMFPPSHDSTELRVRACPLMMNHAVWYHSARVKVLSPSDFQAFCREKKKCWNCAKWHRQLWLMGPPCGRLSDICVRGVIILRFPNVSASWYLWKKKKKSLGENRNCSLSEKSFLASFPKIRYVTLKKKKKITQTANFQLCPKRCLSWHHLNWLLEP